MYLGIVHRKHAFQDFLALALSSSSGETKPPLPFFSNRISGEKDGLQQYSYLTRNRSCTGNKKLESRKGAAAVTATAWSDTVCVVSYFVCSKDDVLCN